MVTHLEGNAVITHLEAMAHIIPLGASVIITPLEITTIPTFWETTAQVTPLGTVASSTHLVITVVVISLGSHVITLCSHQIVPYPLNTVITKTTILEMDVSI